MKLFVVLSLSSHIFLDGLFVAGFSHGVDVEATGPELSTPEDLFEFAVTIKEFSSRDALDDAGNLGGRIGRHALNEEMHMILVRTDLNKGDFIGLSDTPADILERFLNGFRKGFLSVFHGTDQVVEKKRNVMGFMNVPTHGGSLLLRCRKETRQAAGNQTRGD